MIALEAMNSGCQLISTNNPPMPEFFTDIAVYYTAEDGAGLARQIQVVLRRSEEERQAKRHAAQAWAANIRWDQTAHRTIDELELAVSESGRKNKVKRVP